jgi:hypothetical protein
VDDDVARVIALLRPAILAGVIPPGTQLTGSQIRMATGANANLATRALGLLRAEGLAHWERRAFYAAPAGPPDPGTGAWLGRMLTAARAAGGMSVAHLAGRIVDPRWELGPALRASRAAKHVEEITAAEAGTWHPRYVWRRLDAGLVHGGALLRVHDLAYSRPAEAGEAVRGGLPARVVAVEGG